MTKQEFMAMSLPYGLKCQFLNSTYDYTPMKYVFEFINNGKKSTPILRPLSMLTEPCLQGGEIPIDAIKLNCDLRYEDVICSNLKSNPDNVNMECVPMWIIILLMKWHFDIVGLIEKCEAIPVTPEFNPYKQ